MSQPFKISLDQFMGKTNEPKIVTEAKSADKLPKKSVLMVGTPF
jgi:hypothetical protein